MGPHRRRARGGLTPVIPFYGADEPDLFAIERAAMDRPGRVVAALDRTLPPGRILDVGAGDGFTAAALAPRPVVALEPAAGMWRPQRGVTFVGGDAEHLPFGDGTFDAAYSTWAYFFTNPGDPSPGIAELRRVVRPGGLLAIVDNLGDDGFTRFLDLPGADRAWWEANGFCTDVIDTEFAFESTDDAQRLLSRYLGRPVDDPPLRLDYRVGLFTATV